MTKTPTSVTHLTSVKARAFAAGIYYVLSAQGHPRSYTLPYIEKAVQEVFALSVEESQQLSAQFLPETPSQG